MKIKALAHKVKFDSTITTYLVTMGDKKFLLDAGCNEIDSADLEEIDYIFLSHSHFDHKAMLLNTECVEKLKNNVKIFGSSSTIKMILVSKDGLRMSQEEIDNNASYKKLASMLNQISHFESYDFDGMKVTFYPAGHMLGSSMIFVEYNGESLLYTGDMDFDKNDIFRQYYFPENISPDYLIVDGTNILYSETKESDNKKIYKEINELKNGGRIEYRGKAEKLLLYAKVISSHVTNACVIIPKEMKNYILHHLDEGYDIFEKNKIVYNPPKRFFDKNNKRKFVFLSSDSDGDSINRFINTHISQADFISFYQSHFPIKPKKVFIGHYFKRLLNLNNLSLDNYVLLEEDKIYE